MVKRTFAFLLSLSAISAPVPHAVIDWSTTNITGFIQFEHALWQQYISSPTQSNKVANLRLLVVPPQPAHTANQKVIPAGSNIADGGYTLSPSNVVRNWLVVDLTAQEIAANNASVADEVADELTQRLSNGQWERNQTRLIALLSEYTGILTDALFEANRQLQLVTKAVGASALTNNLTAGERSEVAGYRSLLTFPYDGAVDKARAAVLKDELVKAYQLWQAARSNKQAVLNSQTVVTSPPTNWPNVTIGE